MSQKNFPAIVESAKSRPLSFDPDSGSFIYYDDIVEGKKKIVPIEKLTYDELMNLVLERQLKNEPNTTAILGKNTFSNEDLAREIREHSKIGTQVFSADVDYLKFYLSQFPSESFEK